jgi:hypothetical protein
MYIEDVYTSQDNALISSFCLQTSLNDRSRLDDFLQDDFGLEEGLGF